MDYLNLWIGKRKLFSEIYSEKLNFVFKLICWYRLIKSKSKIQYIEASNKTVVKSNILSPADGHYGKSMLSENKLRFPLEFYG